LSSTLTTLTQTTYLGGSGTDLALTLAIRQTSGDVYVAGGTVSTNFPGTTGGAQASNGGSTDAFVARLNSALTTLTQATYLGGSNFDEALALAIHPTSGDVYLAGLTISTNLPGTAGGAQAASGAGSFDAFVARLSSTLTTLTQATYLGSSGDDEAYALAIHPTSGDVYVAGLTSSTNFPGTAGGAQAANGGGFDAFIARLNSTLTTLTQATYLGGSSADVVFALAIRPTSGDVYVAGDTVSTNFPGTTGGAQASNGGSDDAFVARLTVGLVAVEPTPTSTPTSTPTNTPTRTPTNTPTGTPTNTPALPANIPTTSQGGLMTFGLLLAALGYLLLRSLSAGGSS
jgi:hypothetical protein